MDRPAALRSLAVYRAGNVCLAGGAAFVLTVILLYDFFPDSPLVCVLTSADILLFPFIYGAPKLCCVPFALLFASFF